jgi:hypothetical protein
MIQARRFNRQLYPGNNFSGLKHDDESTNATANHMESECASEIASFHGDNGDDSMSVVSESTNDIASKEPALTPKKLGRPPKNASAKGKKTQNASRKRKATDKDEEEDHADESESEITPEETVNHAAPNVSAAVAASEFLDEDERLSPEELQKKIDKTSRQLIKRRDELTFVTNCVRVNDLGQDRYRRRYWHFAHAAGIYVEGLESAEPWKLPTEGMPHFDEDGRPLVLKKFKMEDSDDEDEEDHHQMEVEADCEEKKETKISVNGNNNDFVKKEGDEEEHKLEDSDMANALKKLGSEIFVSSKPSALTPKIELTEYERKYLPKVTPNGDKLNMFNHSSHFNMQLSPVRQSYLYNTFHALHKKVFKRF